MSRIREQRKGAGEYAAADLGEHESAREHCRKTHAALVGAMMVMGVAVIANSLAMAVIVVSVIAL
jgi:hypothetical protein